MASSIAGACSALHALLTAAPGLAGVMVTFGQPDAYEEQEVVALLGIADAEEEFAALGAQRHEESYGIELGLKVHDPSSDAQTVFLRALVVYDVVRSTVNNNRTLTGTVRIARVRTAGTGQLRPLPAADDSGAGGGWVMFLLPVVDIVQRIT